MHSRKERIYYTNHIVVLNIYTIEEREKIRPTILQY